MLHPFLKEDTLTTRLGSHGLYVNYVCTPVQSLLNRTSPYRLAINKGINLQVTSTYFSTVKAFSPSFLMFCRMASEIVHKNPLKIKLEYYNRGIYMKIIL